MEPNRVRWSVIEDQTTWDVVGFRSDMHDIEQWKRETFELITFDEWYRTKLTNG